MNHTPVVTKNESDNWKTNSYTTSEIEDYAKSLGIDPDTEPDLLWIAEEALSCDLPQPWVPLEDDEHRIFFYNTETRMSSWDHPYDDFYRKVVIQERSNGRSSRKANSSPEDSGIACVTRTPTRCGLLQPIGKSSPGKSSLTPSTNPKTLSVDFLATSPLKTSTNKVSSIKKSAQVSSSKPALHNKSNLLNIQETEEPSKPKFIKTERINSVVDASVSAGKKEIEKQTKQIQFSVDLENLSDASHYSYEETEHSDSSELKLMLDAADLSPAGSDDDLMAHSLSHVESASSTFHRNRTCDTKAAAKYDRPSVVPSNRDEIPEASSSSASNIMPTKDRKNSGDFVKEAAEDGDRFGVSEMTGQEAISGVMARGDPQTRLRSGAEKLTEAYAKDLSSLKMKYANDLKEQEDILRQRMDEEKRKLRTELQKLISENQEILADEKSKASVKIANEISRFETEQRDRLKSDAEQRIKNLSEENLKTLETEHSDRKNKLMKEHEQEIQNLMLSYSNQVTEEQKKFAGELELIKCNLIKDNEIEVNGLKCRKEELLDELRLQYERQEEELLALIKNQRHETMSAEKASDDIANLRKEIENLKQERETLKKEVSSERNSLNDLKAEKENVERQLKITLAKISSTESKLTNISLNFVDGETKLRDCKDERRRLFTKTSEDFGEEADEGRLIRSDKNLRSDVGIDKDEEKIKCRSDGIQTESNQRVNDGDLIFSQLKKLLTPIYEEINGINKKVENLEVKQKIDDIEEISEVTEVSDRLHSTPIKDKRRQMRIVDDPKSGDEDVSALATNLLQVSNQLTDLLRSFPGSPKPVPTNPTGILNRSDRLFFENFNQIADSSMKPSSSILPYGANAATRVEDDVLQRWKLCFEGRSSLASQVPGSYNPILYPYSSSFNSKVPSYRPENNLSTRQSLDVQKQWLRERRSKPF